MWKRSSSFLLRQRRQAPLSTSRVNTSLENQTNQHAMGQWFMVQQQRSITSFMTNNNWPNSRNGSSSSVQSPAGTTMDKNSFSTATALSSSSSSKRELQQRFLVVGSGVAGCSAALVAAETYGIPVTLVYAGELPTDCNSYWAQGGIIYRNYDPASNDSAELLSQDVQRAGAGLCVEEAVWKLATEGPSRVRELLLNPESCFADVPFQRNAESGELECCLEASHAAPRIIYKADHTGKVITQHITAAALQHPLINIIPNSIVTNLLTSTSSDGSACVGAMVLNKATGETSPIVAPNGTLLASGGLGGIYKHSTNPMGFNALGSSVALAQRAGVNVTDLEYVQFHPTALYIPNENRYLLTEALRGEGAKLRDATGRAFATDFDPQGELAPRDVVARGVYEKLLENTEQHNVYLDISHRDPTWLQQRFPSIHKYLRSKNLDLTKDALPITPAAHYTCGGITTDLNGCTSLPGLYSAGEAARTGVHGGNRLASTSLLEGIVYGASVADYIGQHRSHLLEQSNTLLHTPSTQTELLQLKQQKRQPSNTNQIVSVNKRAEELLHQLKQCMWDHVGVVRTPKGLEQAMNELTDIHDEAHELLEILPNSIATIALRDACMAGQAVTQAAYSNRKSAGAHYIVTDEEEYDDDDEEDAVAAVVTN